MASIVVDCHFDPKVDLRPVDQFGFVNLREAYDKGVVPGNVGFSEEAFNGMLPDDVLKRPHDVFERYRQADYVKGVLSARAREAQSKAEPSSVGTQ